MLIHTEFCPKLECEVGAIGGSRLQGHRNHRLERWWPCQVVEKHVVSTASQKTEQMLWKWFYKVSLLVVLATASCKEQNPTRELNLANSQLVCG